jgi:hypothetical protein
MHLQRYPKTLSTSSSSMSNGVKMHHGNNINTQGYNTYRTATPVGNDTTSWPRHNRRQFHDIGATLHFYVIVFFFFSKYRLGEV